MNCLCRNRIAIDYVSFGDSDQKIGAKIPDFTVGWRALENYFASLRGICDKGAEAFWGLNSNCLEGAEIFITFLLIKLKDLIISASNKSTFND